MSSGVYGGDEVGALVFDPGHYSLKAGFAGEDSPKAEIPSSAGCLMVPDDNAMDMDSVVLNRVSMKRKYFLDSTSITVARKDTEMVNYLKDGMIEDWDLFENVLSHIYNKHLMSKPEEHPVLMSEAAWNTNDKREKLTEIMFEKYGVPAFYLVKSAVLSAFANGRPTAVVFDSGASQTSAVPVFDGYVVKNAIVRSPIGSEYVAKLCKRYLTSQNIEIVPSYMVASKESVPKDQPAKWTKKSNISVTASWHSYMENELLQDFQASVLQILDEPFTKEAVEGVPFTPYEFPNGFNREFGDERYTIGEVLFNPAFDPSRSQEITQSMSDILSKSVSMCDIDIRAPLYGSVVVTGGNTLLTGFNDRLSADVTKKIPPNIRVKLMHPNGTVERRYSPWIGGSILASLGTFQRMWISKKEYEEGGKSQIGKCA